MSGTEPAGSKEDIWPTASFAVWRQFKKQLIIVSKMRY